MCQSPTVYPSPRHSREPIEHSSTLINLHHLSVYAITCTFRDGDGDGGGNVGGDGYADGDGDRDGSGRVGRDRYGDGDRNWDGDGEGNWDGDGSFDGDGVGIVIEMGMGNVMAMEMDRTDESICTFALCLSSSLRV